MGIPLRDDKVDLSNVKDCLKRRGAVRLKPIYSDAELSEINSKINPLFSEKAAENRSYVRSDELLELGLLSKILSPTVVGLFKSVVRDPVLYHCHIYEIKAAQRVPHINGQKLQGWHRDSDSFTKDPRLNECLSLFVYLSDVDEENGPFELIPDQFFGRLKAQSPSNKLLGPAGTTLLWNRTLWHRACPNVSKTRRRLLKFSFQPLTLKNPHLSSPIFKKLSNELRNSDPELSHLFGSEVGRFPAPRLEQMNSLQTLPIDYNSSVTVSRFNLWTQWRSYTPVE